MEQIESILTDNGDDPNSFGVDDQHAEDASPALRIHHANKIIRPTILHCNQGGFIIMVPGSGVSGHSSFEDAMSFLSGHVHKECYGGGSDLPKVVRDMVMQGTKTLQGMIVAGCVFAAAIAGTGLGYFVA